MCDEENQRKRTKLTSPTHAYSSPEINDRYERRKFSYEHARITSRNHHEYSPTSTDALMQTIDNLKKKLKDANNRIRETERSLQVAKFAKTKRSRKKMMMLPHVSTSQNFVLISSMT